MGVGYSFAMALEGLEGLVICVECDLGLGLPGISVIGMGDAAVVQARDRVRAALSNTGLQWPSQKVVMSLSPAGVPKSGAGYDLAMVCAMLAAKKAKAGVQERLKHTVLVGELGLDGRLRSVPGVLPIVVAAQRRGFRYVVVPEANAQEAAHAADTPDQGIEVFTAATLGHVVEWMESGRGLLPAGECAQLEVSSVDDGAGDTALDMAEVASQPEARRAVEVAAAGGHHLLILGPPGTGKSMLAQRLPGILPPPSREESLEIAAVHSIAAKKSQLKGILQGKRPFVAPHHTVTTAGLIGGGTNPLPGAVSLAHLGVLFLDEIAEISRPVLDTLRVPMETLRVDIIRQRRIVRYPARFQLVCAANPCPCGAETDAQCRCASGARVRYQAKLSGPLRDRIDVCTRTYSNRLAVLNPVGEESSEVIRQRVAEAHSRARHRWSGEGKEGAYAQASNATIPGQVLRRHYPAAEEGMLALQDLLRRGELSQRGVDRALRVSWTLADLKAKPRPGVGEVCDAVELYSDEY